MARRDLVLDSTLTARLDAGIERLGELPVLDQTLVRVRTLSDDPDSTTHELVEALQADANISANLLRFANSAHSATPVRASTLHQAVTLIGRRAVGRMTLEAEVCSFFERAPGAGAARGQLHIHAVQVAGCAAEIARRCGADPAAAHLAGLLHDLGKLVLPVAFDVETLDAITGVTPAGPARVAAEQEALGVDHAAAGARFARIAGLDDIVCDAIDLHHGAAITDDGEPVSLVIHAVQAANATVAMLNGHPADDGLLNIALEALGLELHDLEQIAATAMPAAFADQRGPASLAEEIARLEHEARTDDLTGIANRRHWSVTARDHVAAKPGTVLVCDVDHFKRINDFHGHHTGDFVLVEIGRILGGHGFAGRLGGDEFALLVAEPDPAGVIAARVLEEVAEAFNTETLEVTVSIGTATAWTPGADLTELLKSADSALYEVKRDGRGAHRAAA